MPFLLFFNIFMLAEKGLVQIPFLPTYQNKKNKRGGVKSDLAMRDYWLESIPF